MLFAYIVLCCCFQEEFSKNHGIKKLVEVLALRVDEDSTEGSEKIIEVVLSVIGNCTCKNENCANQVRLKFMTYKH